MNSDRSGRDRFEKCMPGKYLRFQLRVIEKKRKTGLKTEIGRYNSNIPLGNVSIKRETAKLHGKINVRWKKARPRKRGLLPTFLCTRPDVYFEDR